MSNMTICARFRPLSSKERRESGESVCIRRVDAETFIFEDGEKEEKCSFGFDQVFYEASEQADVYDFLALPIVRVCLFGIPCDVPIMVWADGVNGINGTIITYGQTGAGKTYSMEGPGILDCVGLKKGLLPRVVDGLFQSIKSVGERSKYIIKLSMVEIYMEKVRDLLDLAKDNILIKESKAQGIVLSGVTEITISDPAQALQILSRGIANRAVGETQMNMASSRSHSIYVFTVGQEFAEDKRVKMGKVMLVDLAGSEKVDKTGAEGKVLEEAKTINKSLSALGNVINALTCGPSTRASHIPYRDSKLTRILQDSLGGSSRTALLCCCSPSPSNALETLSTLRFGARAKHIKTSPFVNCNEDKHAPKQGTAPAKDERCDRILDKLRESLEVEDVNLLEELFILEGIFFNPDSVEEMESALEDVTSRTISLLHRTVEDLKLTVEELKTENMALTIRLAAADMHNDPGEETSFLQIISKILSLIIAQPFKILTGNHYVTAG